MEFQTPESIAAKITNQSFSIERFLEQMSDRQTIINQMVRSKFNQEAFAFKAKDSFFAVTKAQYNSAHGLRVGDLVSYTNAQGITFVNFKVLAFCSTPSSKRTVYLDMDGYWSPVELSTLTLQDGYIGIDANDLALIEEKYRTGAVPYSIQIMRQQRSSLA